MITSNFFTTIQKRLCKYQNDIILHDQNNSCSLNFLFEQIENLESIIQNTYHLNPQRAAIFLPNSIDFLICLLTTLKINCTVSTLNISITDRELYDILNFNMIDLLFITEIDYQRIRKIKKFTKLLSNINIILIESNTFQIITSTFKRDHDNYTTTDDALIIFTSGTTGSPKGVVLTHENLIYHAKTTAKIFLFDRNTKGLIFVSLGLIMPYHTLLPLLYAGGEIFFIDSKKPYVDEILYSIELNSITTFIASPHFYEMLLLRLSSHTYNLSSLTHCMIGGTHIPPSLREKWLTLFKVPNLIMVYGMTEGVSTLVYLPTHLALIKKYSTGRLYPELDYKLNNDSELLIKGPAIFKKYFRNINATQLALDQDGWYHTGDIVSVDQDGDITILSRRDDVINIHGFIVYPTEVENIILSYENIEECCVVAINRNSSEEQIVAVIVSSSKIDINKLKKYCTNNLITYKVPSQFLQVDTIPKNKSLKIDKNSVINLLTTGTWKNY